MKKVRIVICLFLCAFVCLTGCTDKKEDLLLTSASQETSGSEISAEAETDSQKYIYVYICGAVKHPGVFKMKQGSRIYQLLKKAGGFSEKASRKSVNLAETVTDGQMVTIPEKGTGKSSGSASAEAEAAGTVQTDNSGNKININTASSEELTQLSGIGDSKAKAIVTYREEKGSFQKPEDIMNVSGIGEATYSNIKDDITV